MVGKIRIIAGKWRGRKLTVLDSPGLRPTTSYMRETLFNWLTPLIVNSNCLDCFAGSGALGIEALSRHATASTLVEIKRRVALQLRKNLSTLNAINAIVINSNILTFLKKPGTPYNIVFIDPPFYNKLFQITLILLEKNNWLTDDAVIYIENTYENTCFSVPENWDLYRKKITGQVDSRLYKRRV